ncbi:sigma 54-interacting transcriptional regulator [Halioglobus maricola]|nr:sigma 54-interacting transcriptional regulator [Halioglobus maricola]
MIALRTVLVAISRESGQVLACEGEGPFSPAGMEGRDWRDALGIPPDCTASIAQAIDAGVAAPLPPIIVGSGGERECVMGGMVVPERLAGEPAVVLFLRQLDLDHELLNLEAVTGDDIVAVLGIDQLEFSPSWGAVETERLMMDLRGGLQQVLREGDWIGLPAGATLTLVLRSLAPEAALDICRALLSHLHQRLDQMRSGASTARASIGLAQLRAEQGALDALVAANGALLHAQATGDERIRFASPWDQQGQAARAFNSTGAFPDRFRDEDAELFLRRLVGMRVESMSAQEAVARVLALSVSQRGLHIAALAQWDLTGKLGVTAAYRQDARGAAEVAPSRLPLEVRRALRGVGAAQLQGRDIFELPEHGVALLALRGTAQPWGCMVLSWEPDSRDSFRPSPAALQYLGATLGGKLGPASGTIAVKEEQPLAREMEKGIEGYVLDNMEGAIDQAVFLASVDMPIAVVGARGTGKMYVAQVINTEAGGASADIVRLDCRAYRSRVEAIRSLTQELEQGANKTLVFKSPHLMHAETQARLARMLATRTLSDEQGSRYLPPARYIALFPESLERLVARGELDERLAGVFAGYPIQVPPLRDRGRAVLRWAHKILEQEATQVDRRVLGFTADAEQALQQYNWPGNISEMRDMVREALGRTEKEWVTPVDLGIFAGISADGSSVTASPKPFLEVLQEEPAAETAEYVPSALEELRAALAQALASSLEHGVIRPLGAWLDDEIVLASLERFGGDSRGAAQFMQTRTRNIGRWMPKIESREQERGASLMWQEVRSLVRQWVLGAAAGEQAPQQIAEEMLLALVLQQCEEISVADRARIMGVSTPTYQKRLKQILQEA